MSLESPDNEKNFPGLYRQGSLSEPATEEDGERGGANKKRDTSRKRDGKKDKKEKGYTMFEEEESEEDGILLEDIKLEKSPTKAKKTKPGFKFPVKKDIFPRMKEKEEKKDKEAKKEEKKKEEKEGKKVKVKEKEKKKVGHGRMDLKPAVPPTSTCENPIFGIPLALAVERNKSHDGIQLPAIVRECIDYVEECGLTCEGIYRISGVKSKVQQLKECYNKGVPVDLVEHEPNVVASLLKQFLRELPEPVLTTVLMPKFEDASTVKNEKKKVEMFIRLIEDLPTCNRLLLSWMIVHMTHIIELQKDNKMSLQNVSIVLSPTMQISHRVLHVLFTLAHQIFKDTYLKKYVPPLKPATSRWSLELPENTGALEEELGKQESLLNQLHGRLNAGRGTAQTEEQLWEVQRVVTQLKRKIKFAQKAQGTAERRRKDLEFKRASHLSDTEELHLELRQAPVPPPATTTTAAVVESQPSETDNIHGSSSEDIPAAENQKDASETEKHLEDIEIPPAENIQSISGTEKSAEEAESVEVQATSEACQSQEAESVEVKPEEEGIEEQVEEKENRKSEEVKEMPMSEEVKVPDMDTVAVSQIVSQAAEVQATEEVKVPDMDTVAVSQAAEVQATEEVAEECKPVVKEEAIGTAAEEAAEAKAGKLTTRPLEEEEELLEVSDISPAMPAAEGKVKEEAGREVTMTTRPLEEEEELLEVSDISPAMPAAEGKVKEEAGREVTMMGAGEMANEAIRKEEIEVKEEVPAVPIKPAPAIVEEKEVKPRGPVQVYPHLYLSLEPLQPIKAQPSKPRRERSEKTEESQHRSAELRELEEELLGTRKEDAHLNEDSGAGEKAEAGEEDDYDLEAADDEELQHLVEEEFSLRLEEEELLAIGDELRKKIETEQSEIERLQQEIQELQYLRHDSDLEDMSSGSDSSYESEDEEDMNDMLTSLIQENLQLEQQNAEMCQKIHEERMICLSVKLQIRLLQQKQLESSQSSLLGD